MLSYLLKRLGLAALVALAVSAMAFMLQSTPLARFGASSEIAELAAFMISPDAGFLSGVDILLDGGCTAAMNVLAGTG